jgi:glycosyltransferase involved in cell wall biosynthesis
MGDPEFSKRALQIIINIERRLAKLTIKLITVGEQVSKDLLQVGVGKPNQYMSIASEGQDLNFLSREAARARLNIHTETPVVLWMARMAQVKNPFLALDVARSLPKVNFLMAGGGELFTQIKEQAPSNVFLLSWVDPKEVVSAADIFLSTSYNEGVPYSLLEVLSAGIPVVAVASGAVAEIIENGKNGFLVSQDSADISKLIENLLPNVATRKVIGDFARNSSRIRAQITNMGPAHISLYGKLILRKSPET